MVFSAALDRRIDDTPDLLLRPDVYRSAHDPKFPDQKIVLYVPDGDYDRVVAQNTPGNPPGNIPGIAIERFQPGEDFARSAQAVAPQALLYLPYPYLVPGGRFNEMYGWDTAFPVLAWAADRPRMMREQIDNQLYQIRIYGRVLNANRAYYLGRSHPPLISVMVMALISAMADKPWTEADPDGVYASQAAWVRGAYDDIRCYHAYWTSGDRVAGDTGLSRYWDDFDHPAAEVLSSEPGHYDHAIAHFTEHPNDAGFFRDGVLTPLYYRADRSMRASGFDPTGHWGYGGLGCMVHAPVCLNTLLYRMESDLRAMADMLDIPGDAESWAHLAAQRKVRMMTWLWDSESGVFQDYDIAAGRRNGKNFATVFYPLWAGLFDPAIEGSKIESTRAAGLAALEQPCGISVSDELSGSQWDYPYGWPPLHYFAVAGLARYGFMDDASRIAQKFCTLLQSVFDQDGTIYEKYNVVAGNAYVMVVHGYDVNVSEKGTFLWTAAVARLLSRFSAGKPV